MLVNGDRFPIQCPVVGGYEVANWSAQCPMQSQCSRQQVNDVCSYGYYESNPYQQMQCQRNMYVEDIPQYLTPQPVYPPQLPSYVPPVIPNLPCSNTPQWNYNTMCFNVDGQPCQYTSVVDLEDFMNNEKRKEKSRVAARCRRTKEMQIFTELTEAIPAKKEELEQLDKASVMRLAISYLRVRDVVSMLPESEPEKPKPKGLEEVASELSYMQALDGFVLVFSPQGDIVYCSENIADHIGVTQMEIMGQSVFEFSHPCDHDDIREALRSSGPGRRELLLRLKCTLTSKGRNVHLKSASYKVIHITGHMLTRDDLDDKQNNNVKTSEDAKKPATGSLIAVGRPIPHPANIEIPLDSKTFLSKHSLDMKFTYTDEALFNSLGFQPGELVGQSLYDYHYAVDSAALAHQFKSLLSKGQCETGQYRFLAKTGGYAWVQTQATVITDKQQKPVSVVCVNYVISGIECKDEVFAAHQLLHADLKPAVAPKAQLAPVCPPVLTPEVANGAIVATITPEELRPIPVTELIFAPRNKEMNKGFLMFSQNEGQTMLKEEPEDLTHLAPTAGDACIPLESSPFDMFDEFILSDNYCSLLGDDLANGSPVDTLTADLLSSPEPQENDSSCEQSSLLTELSLDTFDSPRSDDLEDGNSPFIPTSDELPVLESAVMWGALPDNVSLARPQPTESQATSPAPALQRLLAAPTGPPPQDLITNIYSDQGLISSKSVSTWDTGVKRVLKQEEEPMAKRVKRSPSPVQRQSTPKQSSSVLMNLLDMQQLPVVPSSANITQYPIHMNQKLQPITGLQLPMMNVIQVQDKLIHSNGSLNNIINNSMSPLSLNLSPNTSSYSSPALSPALDRNSPYSTPQSMSPIGSTKMLSPDPYLSNKMIPSPGLAIMSPGILLDPAMVTPSDFQWTDTDMLTGTNGLLNAFDDVKLD